ncbi:hypothetical protein RND71_039670 [Anisodus tanguticus]|uniref:cyclin-dependent kinase n=1 Tax=Anisodus tanguticus TaxID=243964 RepID=A0AAE1UXT6_9SOLA|nr:hypothetical protein RND71_039670 [Anisodus tanguticus]
MLLGYSNGNYLFLSVDLTEKNNEWNEGVIFEDSDEESQLVRKCARNFTCIISHVLHVGGHESLKLFDELLELSSTRVPCLFTGFINILTADSSDGSEKQNNESIIVFDPEGTIFDMFDVDYMKPIKSRFSLLHVGSQLRLLSSDTRKVLGLMFLLNRLFGGATIAVVFQKEDRKYQFTVFIERNELLVLLLLHWNIYIVLLIRTSPLRIVKLYRRVIDIHVNENVLHFLSDTFRYVEIIQRCEVSIPSWIRRVLDRDVKPQNLLIDPHTNVLKLADFELDKTSGIPVRTFTHEVVTLWYKTPELMHGSRNYSTPVDVWSAGCIFAEMINQRPLFTGDSEIDEPFMIFRVVGTLSEDTWPGITSLPDYKSAFLKRLSKNLATTGPNLDTVGLDLLGLWIALFEELIQLQFGYWHWYVDV